MKALIELNPKDIAAAEVLRYMAENEVTIEKAYEEMGVPSELRMSKKEIERRVRKILCLDENK